MGEQAEKRLDKKLALVQGRKCDRYDYLMAAFSGISAGLIDTFFVGAPGTGKLGSAADNTADALVKKAAKMLWKGDKRAVKSRQAPESLQQCISYLEQAFPVSYDARYAKDLSVPDGVLSGMRPQNHHLLSLGHSPDVVGLIFSIIDQFTDMASFIDGGRIIRVYPQKSSKAIPYMQGTNIASRLFCGFINWIGHMISDLVGSSSTRKAGKNGRGMGVPLPFYELFLLCDFGDFDGKTFADIAVDVFENGYDLRHGAAMAVPVLLSDVSVRIFWTVKRRAYHKYEWKQCIPTNKHADLRCMLIVSEGGLCLVDGVDAAIRSEGNWMIFLLHLNMIAWFKLILMLVKEIQIRYSFTYEDLRIQIQRMNEELDCYIRELQKVDYAQYEKELAEIGEIQRLLEDDSAGTEQIYAYLEKYGINMQFYSFEEFDLKMQDENFILEI